LGGGVVGVGAGGVVDAGDLVVGDGEKPGLQVGEVFGGLGARVADFRDFLLDERLPLLLPGFERGKHGGHDALDDVFALGVAGRGGLLMEHPPHVA
jgi:hypothetical protein